MYISITKWEFSDVEIQYNENFTKEKGNSSIQWENIERPDFIPCAKINSTWIKHFHFKNKTIKILARKSRRLSVKHGKKSGGRGMTLY